MPDWINAANLIALLAALGAIGAAVAAFWQAATAAKAARSAKTSAESLTNQDTFANLARKALADEFATANDIAAESLRESRHANQLAARAIALAERQAAVHAEREAVLVRLSATFFLQGAQSHIEITVVNDSAEVELTPRRVGIGLPGADLTTILTLDVQPLRPRGGSTVVGLNLAQVDNLGAGDAVQQPGAQLCLRFDQDPDSECRVVPGPAAARFVRSAAEFCRWRHSDHGGRLHYAGQPRAAFNLPD